MLRMFGWKRLRKVKLFFIPASASVDFFVSPPSCIPVDKQTVMAVLIHSKEFS
jgi:hypothetical protein